MIIFHKENAFTVHELQKFSPAALNRVYKVLNILIFVRRRRRFFSEGSAPPRSREKSSSPPSRPLEKSPEKTLRIHHSWILTNLTPSQDYLGYFWEFPEFRKYFLKFD